MALELAAARVPSLGVEQLATRLDDRFRLLAAGLRTAPPRQRTLRAAVEWSYELLEGRERRLLERLAVFAGGWTLEAAEVVCIAEGLDSSDVVDLHGQLVDKSLVVAGCGEAGERYQLLDTIRHYAQDRLVASGNSERGEASHARFFVDLAERATREFVGPEPGRWLDLWEAEHDNFRSALRWAVAQRRGRGGTAVGQRTLAILAVAWPPERGSPLARCGAGGR